MNKAFVNENQSDDSNESDNDRPIPGGKNYMTPFGAKTLQDELKKLRSVERPEVVKIVEWAAGNGDRSENGDYLYGKRKLREIDRRMRYLTKRLESAEVIDPSIIVSDQVLFGATVTFLDEDDNEKTYSIVGIDEADVGKKKISWVSPFAKALLKSRVGDLVEVHSPKGTQSVEIMKIQYRTTED